MNTIERIDSMLADIERAQADRYKLDFTGKTDSEKSEMMKAALKQHELLVNRANPPRWG